MSRERTNTVLGWLGYEAAGAYDALKRRSEPGRIWAERAIGGRRWRITIETDPTGIPPDP